MWVDDRTRWHCLDCLKGMAHPIIEECAWSRKVGPATLLEDGRIHMANGLVRDARLACWGKLRARGFSFPAIARVFGRKTHATILYALRGHPGYNAQP